MEYVVILGQPEPALAVSATTVPAAGDSGATMTIIIKNPLAMTTPTPHLHTPTTITPPTTKQQQQQQVFYSGRTMGKFTAMASGKGGLSMWCLFMEFGGNLSILLLIMVLPHDAHWLMWLHRPVTPTLVRPIQWFGQGIARCIHSSRRDAKQQPMFGKKSPLSPASFSTCNVTTMSKRQHPLLLTQQKQLGKKVVIIVAITPPFSPLPPVSHNSR